MELLQKINKKYLVPSMFMFMMIMGVVSCECGESKGQETASKPSISLEQGEIIGNNDTSTKLKVDGSAYKAGDFTIEVSITGGSIKIGGVAFVDGDKKPLHEILKIDANEEVKADQSIAVEVMPADTTKDLSATIKLVDKDGNEVGSAASLTWKPAVITGLEVTIGDLVGDKIEVTIKAKKDGNQVRVEADDLKDVEVKVTSNQQTPGETATIDGADNTGMVEIEATDINAVVGVVIKALQVKPGTKDTQLTITVNKGGKKIDEKKVNVPAVASVVQVAFADVTIDNINKRANYKIQNTGKDVIEVGKLGVQITNKSAANAKLNGVEYTPNEIKVIQDAGVIGNADIAVGTSSAALTVVIDNMANTDKAGFELELFYDGKATGVKQLVNWLAKNVRLEFADKSQSDLVAPNNQIDYAIKNTGTDKTEGAKVTLKITKTAGDVNVKIAGQQLALNASYTLDLSGEKIEINGGDTAKALNLMIDGNGGTTAEFTLQLMYDGQEVGAVKKVTWKSVSDINLDFVDKSQSDLRAKSTKVKYAIQNTGADKTEKNKMSLKIKKVSGDDAVKIGGQQINVGSEATINLAKAINKGGTQAFDLTIDANGGNQAEFDLHLMYDGKEILKAVKKVTWKSVSDINLDFDDKSPLSLKAPNNQVDYAIQNTGTDKTEGDRISLKITKVSGDKKVKITGGKDLKLGKSIIISLKSENIALKNGDASKKLQLLIEANGGTGKTEFELQLMYEGKPVGTVKKVTWQP